MLENLLEILVDPVSKEPLRLEEAERDDSGRIVSGILRGSNRTFPIRAGIPRIVLSKDNSQLQTQQSFGYKWSQEVSYDSPAMRRAQLEWALKRYGFPSRQAMRDFFSSNKRILDAGCGSGFSSSHWLTSDWRGGLWLGADISEAIDVCARRLRNIPRTHYIQADVLRLPFKPGTFDVIFSEGVLHHTPSTQTALKAVSELLSKEGEILFYVYRKKASIREFTDDYVREKVSNLPPEEAWNALRPLTALGKALAELQVDVEVPEDIPFLGIEAGRYDIQRFFYWNILKQFWNPELDFEANNHINFDWFHPKYAQRQTEEEVRQWCREAGLEIKRFDVEPIGFTVRAIRM